MTASILKTCSKCKQSKPLEAFSSDLRYRGGRRGQCRQCVVAYAKAWTAKNKTRLAEQARSRRLAKRGGIPRVVPGPLATSKQCCKCREIKPLDDFNLDPRLRSGRRSQCKACELIRTNAWRTLNKTKVNARRRARNKTETYRQKARKYMRRWRLDNPGKKQAESLAWTSRRRELRAMRKAAD